MDLSWPLPSLSFVLWYSSVFLTNNLFRPQEFTATWVNSISSKKFWTSSFQTSFFSANLSHFPWKAGFSNLLPKSLIASFTASLSNTVSFAFKKRWIYSEVTSWKLSSVTFSSGTWKMLNFFSSERTAFCLSKELFRASNISLSNPASFFSPKEF